MKRVVIRGIEGMATTEEIVNAVKKTAATEQAEIVFKRQTNAGTILACLRLPEKPAAALARMGELKIGWCLVWVKEYRDEDRCYSCGDSGHRARECRQPTRVCYRCKLPGHIERECNTPTISGETDTSVVQPTPAYAEGNVETSAPKAKRANGVVDAVISGIEKVVRGTRTMRSIGTQTPVEGTGHNPTVKDGAEVPTYASKARAEAHSTRGSGVNGSRAPVNPPTESGNPSADAQGTRNPAYKRDTERAKETLADHRKRGAAVMMEVPGLDYEGTLHLIKAKIPAPEEGSLLRVRRGTAKS